MPEETLQLPVSEQEIQIEAPSFKDKLKLQKKKILIGLGVFFGILAIAGMAFGAYLISQRQIQPAPQPTPTPIPISTVVPSPTPEVSPRLTPTPSPKPITWKTYTNDKHKYQFEYPEDWILAPEPKALDSETLSRREIHAPLGPFKGGTFSVSVRDVPFDGFVSSMEAYAIEPTVPVVVDGMEGKKVIQSGAGGTQYIIGIYLKFDNFTYDLSGYVENTSSAKEKFIPAFNQILSIFRFLD